MSQFLSRLLFRTKKFTFLCNFWSAKIAFALKCNVHFQLENLCLTVIEKGTGLEQEKDWREHVKISMYETAVSRAF